MRICRDGCGWWRFYVPIARSSHLCVNYVTKLWIQYYCIWESVLVYSVSYLIWFSFRTCLVIGLKDLSGDTSSERRFSAQRPAWSVSYKLQTHHGMISDIAYICSESTAEHIASRWPNNWLLSVVLTSAYACLPLHRIIKTVVDECWENFGR